MESVVTIFLENTPFPSIPREDITRLSVLPHKWLKFVLFTICGAHGVLSATPGGPTVEDNTSHAGILPSYYYTPAENG